jgi:hypothetical protein
MTAVSDMADATYRLDNTLCCPPALYRPQANAAKNVGPCCRRSLQYVGHVQDFSVSEHSQIGVSIAGVSVRSGKQLKYCYRMRCEQIRKAITSRVLVSIANRPADGKRSVLFRHALGQDTEHVVFVPSGVLDGHSEIAGDFMHQFRSFFRHPLPEPVPDVPSRYSSIDRAKGPELRSAVEHEGPIKFIDLKVQLRHKILPGLQVKRLTTMWGKKNVRGHEQSLIGLWIKCYSQTWCIEYVDAPYEVNGSWTGPNQGAEQLRTALARNRGKTA